MSADIDPYEFLQIVLNPDGTITRLRHDPHTPPASDPNLPISVLSKDLPLNQSKHTFLRLFLPRKPLHHSSTTTNNNSKFPLIVFFHGGGFILLSAASTMFHDFCFNMAADLGAVVASLEYRLAPENRLPAAYDDAMDAIHWIKTNPEDDWLRNYADYSNVYLMGSSSGGNIAYHVGLHAVAEVVNHDHVEALTIIGLILVQPFFGGTQRTPSELRLINDEFLPLCVTDLTWELSLPVGVDRDHQYCNPTAGDGPARLDGVGRLGWRVLVTGCSGDPLVDRQVDVARVMEEKGVRVATHFTEGDSHGIQYRNGKKAMQLFRVVKGFISIWTTR